MRHLRLARACTALEVGYESYEDISDYTWHCAAHRTLLKRLIGRLSSPGRSAKPETATLRACKLPYPPRHRSEAPVVSAPTMPSNRPPAPSAPRMPRPGA